MAPIPVWSGNLRLSLVLVPVRMFPANSTEGTIAFPMIHEPSGKPINYLKGIEMSTASKRCPKKKSSRAMSTPRGIMS
jgi:non-homologous end joining protein Ku